MVDKMICVACPEVNLFRALTENLMRSDLAQNIGCVPTVAKYCIWRKKFFLVSSNI